MRSISSNDARFEPLAAEVFGAEILPEKEFVTVVIADDITESLCSLCALMEQKEICKRLVCRREERQDKRRVIITEKKPIQWETT